MRVEGAVARMVLSSTMVNVAELMPKTTAEAPEKLVPLMSTAIPPAVLPVVRLRPVTVGALAVTLLKVKESPEPVLDVPLGVVTVMWKAPATLGGDTAVRLPSLLSDHE